MNDDELNQKLSKLTHEDKGFSYMGWENKFPYMGWYWRTVDFSRIRLGKVECGTTGFMENNKWSYDEYECTPEESKIIKDICVDIVLDNNIDMEKRKRLIDYFNTLGPFK